MIQASIYRTDPQQVATKGRNAFVGMNFKDSHASEELVLDYCERLAQHDNIVAPEITIAHVADPEV